MLEEADDGLRLALRSSIEDRWARMELASPRFPYRDPSNPYLANDDMIVFTVRLSGPGLTAEVSVLCLSSAGDGLPEFFEQLSDEFRGWDGTRSWESVDHQFGVDATWASRGHVYLRCWITPSVYDKWTASVVVEVEAGAEMSALASEVTAFLSQ